MTILRAIREIYLNRNTSHNNIINSLYITYDGLLDPLGQSQILPYLRGISNNQVSIIVLSFEKSLGDAAPKLLALQDELKLRKIVWIPLLFTAEFGILGKVLDLIKLHSISIMIAVAGRPKVIHARSHIAAQAAWLIKRLIAVKFIFDFRGFWIDERVDKGHWDLSNPWHKLQFFAYKRFEKYLLQDADHVVVLTSATRALIDKIIGEPNRRVTVIPCCADYEHFKIQSDLERDGLRATLGISRCHMVIGYIGSVGGMYLTDRYFRFLELAFERSEKVIGLAITNQVQLMRMEMLRNLPGIHHKKIKIYTSDREQMPEYIAMMDMSVSFIKPTLAKIASSPTKIGESFACGKPVISNSDIGDLEADIREFMGGVVLYSLDDDILMSAAEDLELIRAMGGERLRVASRVKYGLEVAAEKYNLVYHLLCMESC